MQAQFFPAQAVLSQILPDRKAQPRDQNQRHHRQVDQRVAHEALQRGKRPADRPHQVKARVAERGYRVEHAVPKPLRPAEHRHKPKRERGRAQPFDDGRADQRQPNQPNNAADAEGGHALLQNRPLAQADSPAHRHGDQRQQRHHAQAADLDGGNQHNLPEKRPMRARIDQHLPRHADRARRGEQRRQRRGHGAALRRNRQHEQQRHQKNQQRKADGDHQRRAHRRFPFFLHPLPPSKPHHDTLFAPVCQRPPPRFEQSLNAPHLAFSASIRSCQSCIQPRGKT